MTLCERKEKTQVFLIDIKSNEQEGVLIKDILIHTRSIDERIYSSKTITGADGKLIDFQVDTKMTDSEVKQFELDWIKFWIPKISDEEIEAARNVSLYEANGDKVTIQEIKEEKVEVEAFENLSSQSDSREGYQFESQFATVDENYQVEDGITKFVRTYPLTIFYIGASAFVLALFIAQCCFLPEYPPCSWKKCILECMDEASLEDN